MSQQWMPLHALQLDGQGAATPLTPEAFYQLRDNLSDRQDKHPIWLHFDYTQNETRDWLECSDLPEIVTDALLAEDTRPRVTQLGEGLLIALRGVNLNPGADPEDMVSIRIWITPNQIISSRKRVLLSVREMIEAFKVSDGPATSAELLSRLCDNLVERMGTVVDNLEDEMTAQELDQLAGDTDSDLLRQSLTSIRRQTIMLRRYFAPQRDAFNQLMSDRITWISNDQKMELREVNDALLRHIEDLDMIRERASMTQDALDSRLSDQLNKRMYVLSLIAAIFLPLGFLTGLFGINVGGLQGVDNPLSFWIFSFVLCVLVGLQIWIFRKRGWF